MPGQRRGLQRQVLARTADEQKFILSGRHTDRQGSVGRPPVPEKRVIQEGIVLPAKRIDRNVVHPIPLQRDARIGRIGNGDTLLRGLRAGRESDGSQYDSREVPEFHSRPI